MTTIQHTCLNPTFFYIHTQVSSLKLSDGNLSSFLTSPIINIKGGEQSNTSKLSQLSENAEADGVPNCVLHCGGGNWQSCVIKTTQTLFHSQCLTKLHLYIADRDQYVHHN
ncbi:hypothetical protein CRM22_009990 [Opisthorchis felineus]|uniref:Uncharacterized protein n=1 Tax=Opisthorchis felineus TaxID=147828 RepID=A0A4S2L316_OPIFE|nr:hypothetical protein CRM22_009990 [Opisthorchis felineus]